MATRERREPSLGNGEPFVLPEAQPSFLAAAQGDIEAIRREHIGHERQLRAVGLLFGLGALAMGLTLIAIVIPLMADSKGPGDLPPATLAAFVLLCTMCVLYAFAAQGYRRLRPWIKYLGTPLSLLGLLAVPLGTLIHGYILYLLWGSKGRRVLAPDYASIMRDTPHVKYRYTAGDWIVLGLLVAFITAVALLFIFMIRGN